MVPIFNATTRAHVQQALLLIDEMARWDAAVAHELGLDGEAIVSFFYPGKDEESVVRECAPPEGCLLLAGLEEGAIACGAFHGYEPGTCELLHLWVRNAHRGQRTGRRIVEELIRNAEAAGYHRVILETATYMSEARKIYASLGFQVRDPYREIPPVFLPYTVCMERSLK